MDGHNAHTSPSPLLQQAHSKVLELSTVQLGLPISVPQTDEQTDGWRNSLCVGGDFAGDVHF